MLALIGTTEAAKSNESSKTFLQPQRLTLSFVTVCERIEGLKPINQAVAFSISVKQVCCFTAFNPVPEETQIYHRWYHRDYLVTQIRLSVHPPRWSTYSMIQLRESDKGPWRVDIVDKEGNILGVVRFSITD